jgi:hypothetical protein
MSHRGKRLGGLNIHSTAAGAKPSGSVNPQRLRDARAAANLVKDLRAPIVPRAVARREAAESQRLARAVAAGRISLRDAIEQLRGAA